MIIEIDKESGFCFGVVYAIKMAEEELNKTKSLYCLGDIVHNNEEVKRLNQLGLITINKEEFKKLKNCSVLIRAHGEPPEIYEIAKKNNIRLIDATCPVVLKLQLRIKNRYYTVNNNEQIVIYGKKGHAEVNGLVGQTNNNAIVIDNITDLDLIDFTKPIHLFSQTTKSISGLHEIENAIKNRIKETSPELLDKFVVNDTICRQVSTRGPKLKEFAAKHDVIIFVSGRKSSNGKMLYEVCKSVNEKTYFVSNHSDINPEWFMEINSIGVCGATSTPRWLMENIADYIKKMYD
ncbi:MAG: 4-hydroxy-3-methylbut-2-enyl diphosphate reductase [Marinilabiliales bacterium]